MAWAMARICLVWRAFGHIDHHARLARLDSPVERPGIADADDAVELLIGLEGAEELGLLVDGGHDGGVGRIASEQQVALLIGDEAVGPEHAGVRHQGRQRGVGQSVETVIYSIKLMERLEEGHLGIESLRTKYLYDLGGRFLLTLYGHIVTDYCLHLGRYARGEPDTVGNLGRRTRDAHVVSARDGIAYLKTRSRHDSLDSTVEHHAERTYVAPLSGGVAHRHKLDLLGSVEGKRKPFLLIIYARAHGREAEPAAKTRHDTLKSLSARKGDIFLKVYTIYFHNAMDVF